MSTLDAPVLRQALLLDQAVERRLDTLVRLASAAALRLERSPDMETSQLRNLLAVAQQTPSAEAVINFVRYQIGRNHKERNPGANPWGVGPDGFGHTVIAHVRGDLAAMAATIVDEVARAVAVPGAEPAPLPDVAEVQRTTHVRLIQLYIGYVGRGFYYADKVGSFADLRGETQ